MSDRDFLLGNDDKIEECSLCGARSAVEVNGVWLCDIERGGCNRPTIPADAQYHQDPAFERVVIANGTGPLSTLSEDNPEALLDGLGATDLGNAQRLVDHHGKDVRYVDEWGWLIWSGARWKKDYTGLMMRYAKNTTRAMLADAGKHLQTFKGDDNHRDELAHAKKLIKHAEKSNSSRALKAMVELAASESTVVARPELFDADPFLFNCKNATVNLRNGEPQMHEQGDFLTKLCPTPYDADAQCPTWERFLLDVFGDQAIINYIGRVVGYALTGSAKEQAVFILHGTGSNGKSTFLNTILKVMGEDYAAQIDASSIVNRRNEGANNDIARLRGRRFVSSIEVGEGKRLNEALVKQFTGEDKIAARFLYKEIFEFQPEFKLFIAANHKPEIVGQDHAMWRRVRLIPFSRTFTDEKKDPDLGPKLLKEAPGILAWAVRGCQDWIRNGLLTPDVIKAATMEYKSEMNELGEFLDSYTYKAPGASCSKNELYVSYREWAEMRHEKPMTSTALGRRMHDMGYHDARDKRARIWLGIGLGQPPVDLQSFGQS